MVPSEESDVEGAVPRTEDRGRRTAQGDTQIGVAVDDEARFEKRLVEVLGVPRG